MNESTTLEMPMMHPHKYLENLGRVIFYLSPQKYIRAKSLQIIYIAYLLYRLEKSGCPCRPKAIDKKKYGSV